MARDVDKRKTRKALRRLKRAADEAGAPEGPGLTDWEKGFVEGVTHRLETYGSAFRDPQKGSLEEALSARQTQVARALEKKARRSKDAKGGAAGPNPGKDETRTGSAAKRKAGKGNAPRAYSTFKRKTPVRASRARDINEDLAEEAAVSPPPGRSGPRPPPRGRPKLRLVEGGRSEAEQGSPSGRRRTLAPSRPSRESGGEPDDRDA